MSELNFHAFTQFLRPKKGIWFREDYLSTLLTIPIKSTFKVEVGTPNSISITGLFIKKYGLMKMCCKFVRYHNLKSPQA